MCRITYYCRKIFFAVLFSLLTLPSTVLAAERVIYATGFEDNNGNYQPDTSNTMQWTWGTPDVVAKPAGPAACNGGQKCWGTYMSQTVSGNSDLISPVIAVPTLTAGQVARVSFFAYIDVPVMAASSGFGDIYISSDSQLTWKKIARLLEKMAGGWQRYDFDISEFSGTSINLKFNLLANASSSSIGLYIDDVAVTIVDVPSPTKTLTLTAWEDPSPSASCPWVYTWNGTGFVQDNDIYSVARYEQGKMLDYYLLQKPLVARQGTYDLEIRETETETSWTDMVGMRLIDHAPGVAVAPDNLGRISAYKPAELLYPVTATSNSGIDALSQVNTNDNSGFNAYSDDYIDLNFGPVDASSGAILILRMKGFLLGSGVEKPFIGPPAITVKMQDANGAWQEVGRLNARFEWSVGAFNLTPYIANSTGNLKVRLTSISHGTKYHEIDYAALSIGTQPAFTINDVPPKTATYGGTDVTAKLTTTDNQYVQMSTGNKFSVSFNALPLAPGQARDFVFLSSGYYIPSGDTFFLYTWDGTKWAQRDAVSFTTPIDTFATKQFNLSSYLPDPDGEYKVRIWQDYCYETASIDFVGMRVDTFDGTLATATDLRNSTDIISYVQTADNNGFKYNYGSVINGVRPRDRWTQYQWSGLPTHIPPSVPADKLKSRGGNIRWDYYSPTGDPQVSFDVQVWTGPGATGSIMWSPPTFTGTSLIVRYAGSPLTSGSTYYLRMRLFDGKAWGGWVETAFAAPKRDGILIPATGKTLPDLTDAIKALEIQLGIKTVSDDDLDGGDIAPLGLDKKPLGDGKVDDYDVIGILRKIIGL